VGLVSRAVEEAGIATLTMSVAHDITELVRPPRAAFVNYPMGQTVGRPGHVEEQRSIVRAALTAVTEMSEPGCIVDLPFDLVERAPDGRPWQQWVYTPEYRARWMGSRDDRGT